MFFKKGRKNEIDSIGEINHAESVDSKAEIEVSDEQIEESVDEHTEPSTHMPYTFYKPDPYPKDLISVITKMLQKMFPDTKKAYLMEAHQHDKKGYLLIVDIDPKFVKIINLYLAGETKRLIGDTPIESILYSKSGTVTEGVDPFFVKETAESKANNLASKEFSGDVTFSEMPEFDIWTSKKTESDDSDNDINSEETASDVESGDVISDMYGGIPEPDSGNDDSDTSDNFAVNPETEKKAELMDKIMPDTGKNSKPDKTKAKPVTKKELFSILNEYGSKKSGTISTIAMAAIREFEFYIPYTCGSENFSDVIDNSLAIDESLRFTVLINPETGEKAVPMFTEKESALDFAGRAQCSLVYIKYKDFAASRAFELTGHSGIVINPDDESIFLLSAHPLLK